MAEHPGRVDVSQLQRLKEGQEQAIWETDRQLEQWKKFRSDYVALQQRLKTLPHKTTHEVMVPFGSLAFMPGQLVHTNEILVLLGDNYFLERSAHQAVDIVSRRLKELDKNMESLQKQRGLLTPRLDYTQEMIHMAADHGDVREIHEEYDEEAEKEWRDRHRTLLRQAGQRERKDREDREKRQKKEGEKTKTDADYWDILDRLERQEKKNKELEGGANDTDDDDESSDNGDDDSADNRLEEDETDTASPDDSGNSAEDDDSGDDDDLRSHKTITFSHTKYQDEVSDKSPADEDDDSTPVINSPADLYRLVHLGPKSILKSESASQQRKVTLSEDKVDKKHVDFAEDVSSQAERRRSQQHKRAPAGGDGFDSQGVLPLKTAVKAFTETVVERPTPSVTHDTSAAASAGRLVSKFRAERQQRDNVNPSVLSQGADNSVSASSASQGQNTSGSSRPVSKFRASRVKQGGGS